MSKSKERYFELPLKVHLKYKNLEFSFVVPPMRVNALAYEGNSTEELSAKVQDIVIGQLARGISVEVDFINAVEVTE